MVQQPHSAYDRSSSLGLSAIIEIDLPHAILGNNLDQNLRIVSKLFWVNRLTVGQRTPL